MSVSSDFSVLRLSQIQHLDNAVRCQIENFCNSLFEFCFFGFACSERIHTDRNRICNTDCISELNFALVSESGCYDIFCNISCCISGTSVNFCRVFTGKCTAAEPHGSRTAALITFTDRSRLRHTAALLTDTPLAPEDDAVIAIRTEVFAAGAYPQTLAEASDKDILTGAECKRLIRRQMGRELLTGLILCGIALGAVILTMRLCFGSQ